MRVVHLTASTLFGGPERQMLGLAERLPGEFEVGFVSFAEGGHCGDFLRTVENRGFSATQLRADTPRVRAAVRELTELLRFRRIDAVLCHGYKANFVGRSAARSLGIPAIAVSRGWTGESLKVRAYEWMDRRRLAGMDHVVAVSDGQAEKVRAAGVPESKLTVIRNSARTEAFADPDILDLARLADHFPRDSGVEQVVLAAGRLSPEKGFDVLIDAAARVCRQVPEAGFVLFGEGGERAKLERLVRSVGLESRFVMPGFSRELDRFVPWAGVVALSSHTEGLPNVALEASAAGVPVVATAVGGNAEVVADGETGFIVPPARPDRLAHAMVRLLDDDELRARMGGAARARMREEFSFEAQAAAYVELLERLVSKKRTAMPVAA